MSEYSLDYFGGIIDGEGTIGVHASDRRARRQVGSRGEFEYVCQAGACMTKGGFIIEELHRRFGGCITRRDRSKYNLKWSDVTEWSVRGPKCRDFLKAILPHLHLKRRQAELVLEFFNLQGENGRGALFPDVKSRQLEIYNELRRLNMRGGDKLVPHSTEVISSRSYIHFSSEELRRLYIDERLGEVEIAKKLGCSVSAVDNALDRFKVPLRSRSESAKIGSDRSPLIKPFASKEELEKAYVADGLSMRGVGARFGVSHVQVLKTLRRYGVPIRTRWETRRLGVILAG